MLYDGRDWTRFSLEQQNEIIENLKRNKIHHENLTIDKSNYLLIYIHHYHAKFFHLYFNEWVKIFKWRSQFIELMIDVITKELFDFATMFRQWIKDFVVSINKREKYELNIVEKFDLWTNLKKRMVEQQKVSPCQRKYPLMGTNNNESSPSSSLFLLECIWQLRRKIITTIDAKRKHREELEHQFLNIGISVKKKNNKKKSSVEDCDYDDILEIQVNKTEKKKEQQDEKGKETKACTNTYQQCQKDVHSLYFKLNKNDSHNREKRNIFLNFSKFKNVLDPHTTEIREKIDQMDIIPQDMKEIENNIREWLIRDAKLVIQFNFIENSNTILDNQLFAYLFNNDNNINDDMSDFILPPNYYYYYLNRLLCVFDQRFITDFKITYYYNKLIASGEKKMTLRQILKCLDLDFYSSDQGWEIGRRLCADDIEVREKVKVVVNNDLQYDVCLYNFNEFKMIAHQICIYQDNPKNNNDHKLPHFQWDLSAINQSNFIIHTRTYMIQQSILDYQTILLILDYLDYFDNSG
jgi:hypothetical protein